MPHEPRYAPACDAPCSTTPTSSSARAFRSFLDREAAPHHERWEADGIVDRQLFAVAGANGFLGMEVPEEHGGGGSRDFRFNVVIAEEIQRADVNAAGLGLTLHNDICLPYFLHLTTTSRSAAGCRASAPAS